jgi:hypothetical protein
MGFVSTQLPGCSDIRRQLMAVYLLVSHACHDVICFCIGMKTKQCVARSFLRHCQTLCVFGRSESTWNGANKKGNVGPLQCIEGCSPYRDCARRRKWRGQDNVQVEV